MEEKACQLLRGKDGVFKYHSPNNDKSKSFLPLNVLLSISDRALFFFIMLFTRFFTTASFLSIKKKSALSL